MLLELQNTSTDDVRKLLAFAQQNNLQLSVIDDDFNNYHLPGKPLTSSQLDSIIANSRISGTISLGEAHEIICSNLHGN